MAFVPNKWSKTTKPKVSFNKSDKRYQLTLSYYPTRNGQKAETKCKGGYLTEKEAEDDSLVLRYAYESRRTGGVSKDEWLTVA